MAAPDVEHLLPGVRRGETAALEALIRALADPLYRYAERVTGDPGAAEDIVQDTFIRVYRRRGKLDAGGTLRGYCYRAATNLAFNHIRNRRKRSTREAEAAAMNKAPDPEYAAMAREAWRLADELPDELRATLHLRYAHGLSLAETAQALQVPEGTVSTRQRTGLQKLRDRLAMTAALVPGWELEGALASANPAVPASIGLERRVEAAVMASIGAKSVFNVAVLAAAALLLALTGVFVAVWINSDDPLPPDLAQAQTAHTASNTPTVKEPDKELRDEVETKTSSAKIKPEQPKEEEIDRLALLRQLREQYIANDRKGFAETASRCRELQPWDFDTLLPYFKEVLAGEFKRWVVPVYRKNGELMGYSDQPGPRQKELTLETALIELAMGRIAAEESRRLLCEAARDWIMATAQANPQREAERRSSQLRRDDGHPPENPDAEALGLFATRLIDIEGYEASREFIGRIFLHTGWKDAARWAWIQTRICEALGAARVDAGYSQLDALYLAAEHKSVRHAAFKALTQIKGNEFCSREVERMMGLLEASEKRMPAGFKDRFEMFLIACPSGEMAFDFLEAVMKFGEDRGLTYPMSLSGNVMHQLEWRRPYQREAGIDEKLLILSRFERTDLLGVVKSLGYEVGDVFESTNDAHVKHVLATKIDLFASNGWSKREGYAQSAFTTLIGAYCKVSIDPNESLRMFLNVWYPRHHSWALGGLDFRLRCLLQFHLARTATWGPTHERALDALCQRIEGTGALAYSGKMADTKDIADACAYVPFLQMRQLLIDRIQTTQDAEARKVYEGALEAWKKRHEE